MPPGTNGSWSMSSVPWKWLHWIYMGKLLDQPMVSPLLGGIVREEVPFAAYLFFKYEGAGGDLGFGTEPEATAWLAGRQREALSPAANGRLRQHPCVRQFGFQSIKLKGRGFAAGSRMPEHPGI